MVYRRHEGFGSRASMLSRRRKANRPRSSGHLVPGQNEPDFLFLTTVHAAVVKARLILVTHRRPRGRNETNGNSCRNESDQDD